MSLLAFIVDWLPLYGAWVWYLKTQPRQQIAFLAEYDARRIAAYGDTPPERAIAINQAFDRQRDTLEALFDDIGSKSATRNIRSRVSRPMVMMDQSEREVLRIGYLLASEGKIDPKTLGIAATSIIYGEGKGNVTGGSGALDVGLTTTFAKSSQATKTWLVARAVEAAEADPDNPVLQSITARLFGGAEWATGTPS